MQVTNDPKEWHRSLNHVCSSIRRGCYDDAMSLLSRMPNRRDGYIWNLLGVIHECRRNWEDARRCYGRAIAFDRHLKAPQTNMRRIYELNTFGRSSEPMSLGDYEILLRLR